jgi:hypothetical protein
MRLLHFLGRFIFFITILIIIWYPFASKYLFSSTNVLTVASFFIFYLPLNLIPFFALTLATPIEKSKVIKIIIVGSLIIVIFNVLIIGFQFKFPAIITELFFIYAIGRISIPIIVWLGFVYDDIIGISLQKNSNTRMTKKM